MPASLSFLINSLEEHLPELEWQLSKLPSDYVKNRIPAGVFTSSIQFLGEVKKDLQLLHCTKSLAAKEFIAQKLNQKIHILVAICKQSPQEPISHPGPSLLAELHSRQNRLKKLEEQIHCLREQQTTLLKKKKTTVNSEIILHVEAELGLLLKQLTLVEEAYAKAASTERPSRLEANIKKGTSF